MQGGNMPWDGYERRRGPRLGPEHRRSDNVTDSAEASIMSRGDGIPIPRRVTGRQLAAMGTVITIGGAVAGWIVAWSAARTERSMNAAALKDQVDRHDKAIEKAKEEDVERRMELHDFKAELKAIRVEQLNQGANIIRILDKLDRKERAAAGGGLPGAVAIPPG